MQQEVPILLLNLLLASFVFLQSWALAPSASPEAAQGLSISILEIAVQIRKLKLLELADVPVTHLPSFLLGLWVEFLRTTCVGRGHSAFSLEQPQHSSTGKHLFGAWGLL